MKKIQKIIYKLTASLTSLFIFVFLNPTTAKAIGNMQSGALAAKSNDQPFYLFGATGVITTITNTAMFLIGALCVLMLVFGGLRYTVSGGDAAKVTAAKNTVLYAIIGVVVALMAYAAIDFVTSALATDTTIIVGTSR